MGAARRAGGFGSTGEVNLDELEGFVSEFPAQILEAVPAYPSVAIAGAAVDEPTGGDPIDSAVPKNRSTSRPLRRFASAVWRGICAVAYAPVALVLFVATRIWWFASWIVRSIWRGITRVVGVVTSIVRACARAIVRAVAATARVCVAIVLAIVYAPVALARFVVSIVAACVHAGVRAVVAIVRFCRAVVRAVAAAVRTAVVACVTAVQRAVQATWDALIGTAVFLRSIVDACVHAVTVVAGAVRHTATACATAIRNLGRATWHGIIALLAFIASIARGCALGVVRAVVATGALGARVAGAIASGVTRALTVCAQALRACARVVARVGLAIHASIVFVARAVEAGALAFVTAVVGACVYGVVWTVVVARRVSIFAAHGVVAGVKGTGHHIRAVGAALARSIRRFVTSVFASAAAAARAGEAGAERAVLAGGRSCAHSATAIASRVSAVRSGAQAVAATAAREVHTLSDMGRRVGRRAHAAGQTWFTGASDTTRAATARVAAFKVTVRVGVTSTGDASGRAWSRMTEAAPTIGAIALAGLGTASTVLVMWTLPGAPARQARVRATEVLSPVQAASVAPVVNRQPAPSPVRPAVARLKGKDEVGAVPIANARGINANRMRAIWLTTDTRSLDRALSTVRQTTLAFRSCSVQLTATDQAVAHCDLAQTAGDGRSSSGRTAWTIDFTRAEDQWRIDGITETSSGRLRR